MHEPLIIQSTNIDKILSERIKSIFNHQLGHPLDEINCNFLENKLVIVIKQALTQPELLLIKNGHKQIAQDFRNSIEEILRPQLKKIIEEVTEMEVMEILFSTHLDANYITLITLFVDNNS